MYIYTYLCTYTYIYIESKRKKERAGTILPFVGNTRGCFRSRRYAYTYVCIYIHISICKLYISIVNRLRERLPFHQVLVAHVVPLEVHTIHTCMYIHMYLCMQMYTHIYTYVYRERKQEREKERVPSHQSLALQVFPLHSGTQNSEFLVLWQSFISFIMHV